MYGSSIRRLHDEQQENRGSLLEGYEPAFYVKRALKGKVAAKKLASFATDGHRSDVIVHRYTPMGDEHRGEDQKTEVRCQKSDVRRMAI